MLLRLFLALSVILAASCEKDPAILKYAGGNKFFRNYYETLFPYSIFEDTIGNIGVFGAGPSQAKLVKIDPEGNLLWSRDISSPGVPRGAAPCRNRDFLLITTKDNTTHQSVAAAQAYYEVGIGNDSAGNCIPIYMFTNGYEMYDESASRLYLTRVSSEGEVLWQQSFASGVFDGKAVLEDKDGTILLLTYHPVQAPPYIAMSGTYDYYNFDHGSNVVTLHRLDKNGALIWKRAIENVYFPDKPHAGSGIEMLKTSEKIHVKLWNQIVILDDEGYEIRRIRPASNACHTEYITVSASGENTYASVRRRNNSVPGGMEFFIIKYSDEGSVSWKNDNTFIFRMAGFRSGGFAGYPSGSFAKINDNGTLAWKKLYNEFEVSAIATTADNGVLAAGSYPFTPGIFKVMRTNDKGDAF